MNPFSQGCFVPSLFETNPVILEKKISKFLIVFSLYLFPIGKGRDLTLHLNKIESPSSKNALCQVWWKLAHWFWRGNFNSSSYFRYFASIYPMEIGMVFI